MSPEANRRLFAKCADCRVRMSPAEYDLPEAHAVNCPRFQAQKQAQHFPTHFSTGKALDKAFWPKGNHDTTPTLSVDNAPR